MTDSTAAVAPPAWHAIGASVTGAAHLAQGRANEDAFTARSLGGTAVAAVADGHGSSRCPRAAAGARFAVDIAAELLEGTARASGDPDQLRAALTADVAPALVQRWRQAVGDDAAANPFTPQELEATGAGPGPVDDAATWLAYGCTLVATVATAGLLGVLQIGDGDCVLVDGRGRASRPLPDDPTNRGNVTSSLSQSDPLVAVRCAAVDLRRQPQLLAFVSSDGFGGAYTERDWWQEVGGDLAERALRLPVDELERRLPEWLAEPAKVGGDDSTMALLVTGDPGTAADGAATFTTPVTTVDPGADTLEPPSPEATTEEHPVLPAAAADRGAARSRRAPWVLVLAVAVIAAVALAGWVVAGSSDDADAPPVQEPVEQEPAEAPSTSAGVSDAERGVTTTVAEAPTSTLAGGGDATEGVTSLDVGG